MSVLEPVTEPLTEGAYPAPAVLKKKFTFGWKFNIDYKSYGNYLELPACAQSAELLVKYFELLLTNVEESMTAIGDCSDVDTITFILKKPVDNADPLNPPG